MHLTPTPTETWLSVTRPESGGRVSVRHTAEGGPARPVIRSVLQSSTTDTARISLVPEGALLLKDDDVRLHIDVGAGATLVLVEPAGTVAYDMRGGAASWQADIHVGAAGRLVWHGEPFVVAAGAAVRRRVHVTLGQSARLALRESLVLGRHGERGGRLEQLMTAETEGGQPLVVDGLHAGPDAHALSWGDHKAITTVLTLGVDLPAVDGGTRLDLEAGGSLVRSMAAHAHDAELSAVWHAATAAVQP